MDGPEATCAGLGERGAADVAKQLPLPSPPRGCAVFAGFTLSQAVEANLSAPAAGVVGLRGAADGRRQGIGDLPIWRVRGDV